MILLIGAGLGVIGQAADQPLSQSQILDMVRSGTPTERVVESIQQNGIDFKPEKGFLKELREAGAAKAVTETLKKAKRVAPQPSGVPDVQKPLPEPPSTSAKPGQEKGVIVIPGSDTAVTPPKPIHIPQPEYTPAARKAKIQGDIVFWVVIDAQGNVTEVAQTSAPLGKGLDENAAATVRTWKFEPAKRNGVPVPVKIKVEVTFRLLR
jgi:TonB family protein